MFTVLANIATLGAPIVTNPTAACYFGLAAVYGVAAYFYRRHKDGVPLAGCAAASSALHGALGTFSVMLPH